MNGAVNLILELADKIAEIRLVIKQDKYNFDYDKWEKLDAKIDSLKYNFCCDPQCLNDNFIVDLAKEIRILEKE